jgi:glucose-6-phosphate 1-dehydrogenase
MANEVKQPYGQAGLDHSGKKQERVPDPCIVVIFGASGDLTKRKLLPALYHLEQEELLPESCGGGGGGRGGI